MDPYVISRIDGVIPKLNKDLANGLAVKHMMEINPETGMNATRAYVDKLFEINSALFPADFKYHGNRLCKPEVHFEEITREYGSKRVANIAESNTYMIELITSYKGEMMFPRRVLLPYVRDGGICTLNGATYSISPVLTDVGFSVLNGSIFIPFRRAKLTFKQVDHHYMCNGQREVMYVIWSQIHNEMSKRTKRDLDNRQHIESCLAHYFFCEFGVVETFKRWAGVDIQIGYLKDFPESQYPRDQWNVYESAVLKRRHPTGDMVLVLPKDKETDFVRRLVAGFWYVVDAFPSRFYEPSYMDNKQLWRIILGLMIFGDFEHQGKIAENIESHLDSFNNSLDEMTIEELRSVGVKVNTIWELLYAIMTDMAHHLYATDIDETSMYDKRLSILRYVMAEFNYAVSMFAYTFQGRKDKEWTGQEINDALKRSFKLNTCIKKLTSEHGELDTLSSPGDSKVIKVTSILVPQDRAKTSKAHNKSLIGDSSRLIHASIAEVGQYKNQPKNNPDGRGRLNLFVGVRYDGLVERREEDRELIDKAQQRFVS
ncbi:hypothetical protein [Pseudomonas phage vB_PaeM_PS119XW]|uniref:Uncharacterized protein n=1 Tax=Pseudomonas phage vB_PaeM_PS119XW TaxID=2601632 RepID=A0A5C1K8L6_9CAUD|nr:polymerase [Pseudomonas phage vB_PaeM_PS119XW]QEM41873.1 hypothetical protein [Pseudomonas phage vB_PaeM_PS119XW]BEG72388.1 hypothetical protein RVBP21_0160 [Pseudomonas phage BRkr]